MNDHDYKEYISEETLMGPSCVRILKELLETHPLQLSREDMVLDLGCGKGLTSLVIARETGAKVYANDLWISAQENSARFESWGMENRIVPVCEDANELHFEKGQFRALLSVDAYHYFAGKKGFFEQKILPYLKSGAEVLIGVPGIKDGYAGRSEELLAAWLGSEACMFKSPKEWKEIIGRHERLDCAETWEMACFDDAWNEWLAMDQEYARGDLVHYETIIKPYTCLVGIHVRLK
ncbi:MAG: methyltransferase domain-containing protein [Clostridia bacterium]|nr:methyltransferase domain-containing protein [Clostridia bacterium]